MATAPSETEQKASAPSDQETVAAAAREQWIRSPENLRNRGRFLAIAVPGVVLLYGGGALATLGTRTLPVAGGIALALLGFGLLLWANVLRSQARASFYERQEKAAKEGVDSALEQLGDETDLRGLLRLNRRQMEAYEALTRRQAASSYRLSHVALAVGFGVVIAGAIGALSAHEATGKVAAAGLGAIGATISGFIARTYLRIYERTLVQLNHYFEQPLVSSYVLTAERLVDKMSPERRDDALARVIDELLGWRSSSAEASGSSPRGRGRSRTTEGA